MADDPEMLQTDLAWLQLHYEAKLHSESRLVLSADEAAAVHGDCWNATLRNPDLKAVLGRMPFDELLRLRDHTLPAITADHYHYALGDLRPYFRNRIE